VNDPLGDNTRKLAALLEGREAWRLEADDEGPHWFFGADGEGRLAITAEMDGFRMCRADQDTSWVIPRIEQVRAWLDEHEHEHAGLSATGEAWKRAAEEMGKPDPGA